MTQFNSIYQLSKLKKNTQNQDLFSPKMDLLYLEKVDHQKASEQSSHFVYESAQSIQNIVLLESAVNN